MQYFKNFRMRISKFLMTFLLGMLLFFSAKAQFPDVVKKYFRVNPFEGNFSSFVKTLLSDSALLNKTIVLKTDSTNFFVKGSYKIFNPFRMNAAKVDMIFAENQTTFTATDFTIPYTHYLYQIVAYFDDTPINRKLLLKDFNRLKKQVKRYSKQTEIQSLKGVNNIEDGEIANYYSPAAIVYPATVSWQTISSSHQIVLTFLVRLAVTNNRAEFADFAIWEEE